MGTTPVKSPRRIACEPRSEAGPTPDTWENPFDEAWEATVALREEWKPYRFRNSEKGVGLRLARSEKK